MSNQAGVPADNAVQQVINQASDLLSSLSLDEIVSDRIAMNAEVKDETEYVNSNLEVMDLGLEALEQRDPSKFRAIADRFVLESDADIRLTGLKMLLQLLKRDGDGKVEEAVEALLFEEATHTYAVMLLIKGSDHGQRALIQVMIDLVFHYQP